MNKYVIALTAALGLIPIALDSTIVNVAIVPISKALHADISTVQWIFLGYLLANAAVVSLSGYLANRFGIKRLFILGLALFTGFSFLCGIASSEGMLIVLRVLQGLGGGMLIPLGMAIALQPFAAEERARANVVVGVPLLLAPVLGPILGGVIIDNLNWQAIFFINIPFGALAIALAWFVLPRDEAAAADGRRHFDYFGLALSTVGVVALIYAFKLVSQTRPNTTTPLQPLGAIYGWGYWEVWALVGGGLALLVIFTVYSLRLRFEPVLDLSLFTRYDFAISNMVVWVSSIVSFGVLFLIPVYLQEVHLPNLSALDTGIALLPMGAAMMVGMVLSAGLYRKLGARIPVVLGAILFAVAFWQLGALTPTTASGDLWPWLMLVGLSFALTLVPTQTLALQALSGAALNKATSLVNSTKLLWGSIGSAVLVTLFVERSSAHWDQLLSQFLHRLPGGALNLHDPQMVVLYKHFAALAGAQAGTDGMTDVFKVLICVSAALALLGLALPGRQAAEEAQQAQAAAASAEHVATVA
jgi:EmrB/QacA subfamily drug resistance transporter